MHNYNKISLSPLDSGQPTFIRIVRRIVLAIIIVSILLCGVTWVLSVVDGRLFVCPLGDDIGLLPGYWALVNTCIALASLIVPTFITICLFTLFVSIYCRTTHKCAVPTVRCLWEPKRDSLLYKVLAVYGGVFLAAELFGFIWFIVEIIMGLRADDTGMMLGMTTLIGPFMLAGSVGVLFVTALFCVGIILLVKPTIRMINFLMFTNIVSEDEMEV